MSKGHLIPHHEDPATQEEGSEEEGEVIDLLKDAAVALLVTIAIVVGCKHFKYVRYPRLPDLEGKHFIRLFDRKK